MRSNVKSLYFVINSFIHCTVKAGYNEPNVLAIFVRYRMSSLYKIYII